MKQTLVRKRIEFALFSLITLLNLLPFVFTKFFPSMDGASHLANSNIINQVTVHSNDFFRQFFILNPEPVPNWISHFLVSLMTLVIPAFLAEKIVILLILTGIPFAFRALIHTLSPGHRLFSYLVFPFTHSMFFFFGFFNFCMGILVFLITLNYWLKQEKRNWNPKSVLYLALLVALCYFSHIVIFGILMIALATQIVISTLAGMISEGRTWKSQIRQALRNSAAALLSAALPLALFIYFFYSRPEIRDIKFLSKEELLNMIVALRPLVSMNPAIEGKFLQILFYALLFILVAGFLRFVFRLFHDAPADEPDTKTGNTSESLLPRYPFWWILSFLVVLLVLFFKLPDAYGTASYTNLRIGFFILLFTVVWFSTFRIPWFLGLITVLAGLTVNTLLLKYYTPGIRDLGRMATECNKASEFVKPNSLVLPIYCMDNWFTGHFVDYLAVDKPVVMVYNYECESGYFPVRWNENRRKNYYLGNPSFPDRYIHFEIVKNRPSLPLDYVFIVGQYDPAKDWFFSTLHKALTEDYTRLYQAENCSLYGRKSAATY